jgi:hypothetical protein
MGGIIAATNQKSGKRRRHRKESKVAIIFSILLIVIGSLIPLGLIFLSNYSGETFPIMIIGIVFLIIFGSLILTFAFIETAYDEEEDHDINRSYNRNINSPERRDHVRRTRESDDRFYWGNPESKVNQEPVINYCSQCGSQIEYDDQFCATCGRRIN